jgi:hypothetical protein
MKSKDTSGGTKIQKEPEEKEQSISKVNHLVKEDSKNSQVVVPFSEIYA